MTQVTIGHILAVHQTSKKTREKSIETLHILVDFTAAAISKFDIRAKLIRLCKQTLSNTKTSVRIGKDLFEPFDTKLWLV